MADATTQLSEREREILKLVATGATNQQIANDLGISANTVKVHVRNIFGKIGAASRTEATVYAMRAGIIPLANGSIPPPETIATTPVPATPAPTVTTRATLPANAAQIGFFARHRIAILGTVGGLLLAFALIWLLGFRLPQATTPPIATTPAPAAAVAGPNDVTASWLAQRDLPIALTGAAAASIDGQIYVIGGATNSTISGRIWRYDPANSAWVGLTDKPTVVKNIQAIVLDGKLYVPGGEQADGSISNTLEVYDPVAQAWATKAVLPAPRSGYGLVAFEGRLYLFGGWDGTSASNETLVYDPAVDQWSSLAAMPTARAYTRAVVVDGKVYVLGGEANGAPLTANEQFTPTLGGPGTWVKVTPLQQPRSRFGASALTNNIVVVGGANNEEPARYDVRTGTWQNLKPPVLAIGSQPAVVTRDSSVFVVAGDASKAASAFYELRLLYNVTITLP